MSLRMFPAKIENLRRNPVCLQRYRHVVARKRQHGLTTTLIYATTPGRSIGKIIAICEAPMPRRRGRDRCLQALAARGGAHAMFILEIKINNPQIDKL
ncbi:hypothetical protein [Ralstonia pseudosolanacearum]|uniref:hypothetical protein n=1 Tax=Ralstonia pseudosolanacearum TaxID=1310165 RepID=UPI00386BCBC2